MDMRRSPSSGSGFSFSSAVEQHSSSSKEEKEEEEASATNNLLCMAVEKDGRLE